LINTPGRGLLSSLLSELKDADEVADVVCLMSPEPWRGFNGVVTVAATSTSLWVASTGLFGLRVRRHRRDHVSAVSVRTRRALFPGLPRVGVLTFFDGTRHRRFVSKNTSDVKSLRAALHLSR